MLVKEYYSYWHSLRLPRCACGKVPAQPRSGRKLLSRFVNGYSPKKARLDAPQDAQRRDTALAQILAQLISVVESIPERFDSRARGRSIRGLVPLVTPGSTAYVQACSHWQICLMRWQTSGVQRKLLLLMGLLA